MNTDPDTVFFVDDDTVLCELLGEFLSNEGFDVKFSHSGQDALNQLDAVGYAYDVMILDIMMPEMSGFDVLQRVRRNSQIPIIMLTGRGDDVDKIVGLEMGADDYLGKPCNPRELSARLKALLRRTKHNPEQVAATAPIANEISLHNITLNKGTLEVSLNGQKLSLTSAEFNLLQLLMQSAGQMLTKSELTERVLQRKLSAYDRSIDVHISRIRQKLIASGGAGEIIKSIRGVGYQMLAESHEHN